MHCQTFRLPDIQIFNQFYPVETIQMRTYHTIHSASCLQVCNHMHSSMAGLLHPTGPVSCPSSRMHFA